MKCVFCKTAYRVPVPAAPVVAPVVAPKPAAQTSGRASGIVVMAVGLMVVASSVAVFVLYRSPSAAPSDVDGHAIDGRPSPRPASSPVPAPAPIPITRTMVAPSAEPSAVVVHRLDGTNSIGGRFFLVEVKNDGEVPIANPAVVASGYDASGKRVLEQPGYARRQSLAPGESTVILVSIREPPSSMTRVEIAPRLRDRAPTFRDVAVAVVESTERPSFGSMHEIVGTVRNDGAATVQFVQVVAVGRDADGTPVSFGDAFPTNHTLAPGESSGFTVSIGTWEIRRPVDWELVAIGR